MGTWYLANSVAAFWVSRMIISSGVTTKKKAVFSRSVRMPEEVLMRPLMYCSSARISSSSDFFLRSSRAATWEYSCISSRSAVTLPIHSS